MNIVYVNTNFRTPGPMLLCEGEIIVNAPRPLPGRITWEGEFLYGVHYATGHPDIYGSEWEELKAWRLVILSDAEIVERVKESISRDALRLWDLDEMIREHGLPERVGKGE